MGTALADQVIGNMMTESFMPSLFHQDPRYFRMGKGHGNRHAPHGICRVAHFHQPDG